MNLSATANRVPTVTRHSNSFFLHRHPGSYDTLRASGLALSPPGMVTAPPATIGLSRGWCGMPNTSPGANYLPSRTPTAPDVTGSPIRSSRTTTTRATVCSPRYRPEGEVSTGASKLGPRD